MKMEIVIRIIIVSLTFFSTTQSLSAHESIMGRRMPCLNEGEPVAVDSIKDIACFNCICQNGFVECEQENCPSVDDCYMLERKNGCCEKCKECNYRGTIYTSGAEWSDADDPCASYKCIAGVVTESSIQCYVPCNNPLPPRPGQCCATCLGCLLNGQTVYDNREVALAEDPCLKCSCNNKRLTCLKKACPVLQCPLSKQIKLPGECCSKCSEKRKMQPFPGKCILGKGFYNVNERYNPDECSSCTCLNGTSICRRESCPVLECSPAYQKLIPGECCPHCPTVAKARSTCTYDGKSYQSNETWNLDPCSSCRCHDGEIRCAQAKCPVVKCRPNETLVKLAGQCCARCEESAGTCTVFGDPHYKTFDGKFFSFQGSCKYQLASDCIDQTFSIRVTNDARNTRSSSWTKTVTLKMQTIKVNLGQKMRIKVNGTRITPPYKLDNIVQIDRTDDGIAVSTSIGINLLWDGISFLQIQAGTQYKGRLCGLCGNYNNIYRDDLTSRNGINYTDEDVGSFANSWKVGGIRTCSRKHEKLAKTPFCRQKRKLQYCKSLKESDLFNDCNSRLNPVNYFESCRNDMCECVKTRCFCDSFAAYVHECRRVGGYVPENWRHQTDCEMNTSALVNWYQPKVHKSHRRKKKKIEVHERDEQLTNRGYANKQEHDEMAFLSQHVPSQFLRRTPLPLNK